MSVGIDHDTARFAVHTIRRWWKRMGRSAYPDTTTEDGLRVRSEVDPGHFPNGVVIRDEQMAQIQLEPHASHDDWN